MIWDVTGTERNHFDLVCVEQGKGRIGPETFDVGEWPGMEIDVAKVTEIAHEFDSSSGTLAGIVESAKQLAFGSASAGRNYGDVGIRVAAAYDGIEAMLRSWSESSKDNAVQLRGSVAAYTEVDEGNAQPFAGSDSAGPR